MFQRFQQHASRPNVGQGGDALPRLRLGPRGSAIEDGSWWRHVGQQVDLREHLQETIDFPMKNGIFRIFPLNQPIELGFPELRYPQNDCCWVKYNDLTATSP